MRPRPSARGDGNVSAELTDRQRKPHTAKPLYGSSKAWWYEDDTGICIYIQNVGARVSSCRITRRQLAALVERTKP